jgi:hypothetical protein
MVIIVNQHFYVGVLLILAASLFISVDATLSLEQQMRQTYVSQIYSIILKSSTNSNYFIKSLRRK